MLLDLATAKLHLRIDGSEEDALVQLYRQAAQDSAEMFLNRKIYEDSGALAEGVLAGDLTGIVANGAINAAVLLICGTLYANREGVVVGASAAELPGGVKSLLWPYRLGLGA